jgi:hypothetical protein
MADNNLNLDDLFGDMFGNMDSSDQFANIFNEEPKTEEKKEEPKQEAPVAEPEQVPVEENPAEEKAAPAEEVKEEAPEPEAAQKETTEEAKAEETPAEEPKAEEAAQEEETEEEPVPEVKVEKKTRRRRKKADKETEEATETTEAAGPKKKTELKGDLLVKSEELDEDFVKSLLIPLGPKYAEQKAEVSKMMNDIVLTKDMKPAVVQMMLAQNTELARYIEFHADGYIEAYNNLTDKESGLITRVKAQAAKECDGTKEDKQYAATLALVHYKDPKTGKEINLMDYMNALRAAKDFFNNARNYSKSVGISLTTFNKLSV